MGPLRNELSIVSADLPSDSNRIRDLVKLDATIRESMRCSPMAAHGLTREVVPPGGVTTPSGVHLPQGCYVAADIGNMQLDPEYHDSGCDFDPLRNLGALDGNILTSRRTRGAAHADEKYLTFSLGW